MKKIDWLNHLFNFVAVIAGVFIAFYVDDAAQHTKEQKELRHIVNAIVEDIENDQSTFLEYQIPTNKAQAQGIERLITAIMEENEDSIAVYFETGISIDNFHPTSATYNSAKTTGKIDLINNLEVKAALSDYYDVLSEEAKAKGQVQADFLLDLIIPWVSQNTNLINGDFSRMKGNAEIANLLGLYRSFIASKTENYKDIARVSKDLEALIKKEYNLE